MSQTIRTTINPSVQITVSDGEYAELLAMGLVYGVATPGPPDPSDVAVAGLLGNSTSQTYAKLLAQVAASVQSGTGAFPDALRAAYRLAGFVFLTDYGTVDTAGNTDCTPAINAALADLYTLGGGTLLFPRGALLIAGQIVVPNDGGAADPTFNTPRQPSMVWQGAGGFHTGQRQSQASHLFGGTRLHMTYQNATYNNAKIVTRGLGRLAVNDMTMYDPATTRQSTPFLYTTNTTLHVSRVAFIGSGGGGTGTMQDAVVLGGTKKHAADNPGNYNDPNSAFQGYGTVVERCYFDSIRRTVFGRSFVNHVVIRDNFMDKGCGTDQTNGGCIELNAGLDTAQPTADGDTDTADLVMGNYMNGLGGYAHSVKLVGCSWCNVVFNGSPDQQNNASFVSFVGAYSFTDNTSVVRATTNCLVVSNLTSGASFNPQLFEDTASAGQNMVIGQGADFSMLRGTVKVRAGGQNPALIDKLTVDGVNTGLMIQPSSAHTSDATVMLRLRRANNDATLPGTDAVQVLQSGQFNIRGANAGFLTFTNVAGTIIGQIDSNGRRLRGMGAGDLTFDATSGGYNNFWGAAGRFYTGTSGTGGAAGPLRMRIGFSIDGFELGAASDLSVQRDSNNCLAVNRPIKALTAATASRPAASSVSAGSWMFDSTLNKPIWSTGSAWVDATGTAV